MEESNFDFFWHMSLIENADRKNQHYYIPHHCLVRPESLTTILGVIRCVGED